MAFIPEWLTKRGRWLERGAPGQAITDQRPVVLPQRIFFPKFREVWDFPLLGGRLVKDGWLFPQELPERGRGLIIGTARKLLERGRGVPLTEEERKARHKAIFGEVTSYPIFPILDRPHPVLDWVKERDTIIPRVKILGAAGVVNP